MAEKMNWAKRNRQRMSHITFTNPGRGIRRWVVRRTSDNVLIASDMTESKARRFAAYLTRTATDDATFEACRKRSII